MIRTSHVLSQKDRQLTQLSELVIHYILYSLFSLNVYTEFDLFPSLSPYLLSSTPLDTAHPKSLNGFIHIYTLFVYL